MSRVIVLLALLAGCAKTEDVYEITVALESNSCGSSVLPLPDGLTYRTQFKTDPPRASWKVLPKGAPINGSYNAADGTFRFSTSSTLNLDSIDAGAGQLACTVIRTETLTGTLEAADAGSDADSPLTGEHIIGFSADSNGRCRGVVGPLYPFDRIPCEAKYEIAGEAKEER
jgi:hypothetical protein